MDPLAGACPVATTTLALAGAAPFGFAMTAYRESGRRSMATLLAVNTGLYAASTSLLAVSLVVREPGTREFVISDGDLAEFQK